MPRIIVLTEPDWDQPDPFNCEPIVTRMTEQEVLDFYWTYWSGRMKALGREELMTKERCIDDFITVHWAVEEHVPD